jgi:hypothetical protein
MLHFGRSTDLATDVIRKMPFFKDFKDFTRDITSKPFVSEKGMQSEDPLALSPSAIASSRARTGKVTKTAVPKNEALIPL